MKLDLSVFKKDDNKDRKVYPLPIILDGEVQFDNLYNIGKTKRWLLNTMLDKNIKIEEIFYAFCKNNDLYIIKNDELKNKNAI